MDIKKKVSSIVLARQRLNQSSSSSRIVPPEMIATNTTTRIAGGPLATTTTAITTNTTMPRNSATVTSRIRSPMDSLMDSTTLGLKEIADSVLSELKKNPKRKEVVVNVRVMRICKDKKKKCVKAKVSTLSYKFNVNQKVLQRMIHESKKCVKRK